MILIWLTKWWRWVLVSLGFIGAFIAGILVRRPRNTVPADDGTKQATENATQKQELQAQAAAATQQAEAKTEHDAAVATVIRQEQKAAPALQVDPDAMNEFLKQIGQDVRKP